MTDWAFGEKGWKQNKHAIPTQYFFFLQIKCSPTSFYSFIESLLYGGHVKGWVKPKIIMHTCFMLVNITDYYKKKIKPSYFIYV